MPAGSIMAFYNGVRMRSNALDTDKDNWEANAYKVTIIGYCKTTKSPESRKTIVLTVLFPKKVYRVTIQV